MNRFVPSRLHGSKGFSMKVTVLYGGPSDEREISLISGRAVIDGLKQAGHEVFPSDISPTDLDGLDRPCDVIFPVLHGKFGESGELQEILEQRKLPFVGSGSKASRLGMDKVATKEAWQRAGLPTPKWSVVTSANDMPQIPGSCVVKAIASGSSIDVYLCKAPAECEAQAADAVRTIVAKHGRALVEQYVQGPELTVGLLEEKPLAPIRILPNGNEFFDFEAKYKSASTEHRIDTGLDPALIERCRELARQANEVVGARDLARIDIMIDEQSREPYLLEINTLPGFTPKSLLPEAAAHAGIDFVQLVDRLVKRAAARA
jgi:D-alanine-D-alanine ligase